MGNCCLEKYNTVELAANKDDITMQDAAVKYADADIGIDININVDDDEAKIIMARPILWI